MQSSNVISLRRQQRLKQPDIYSPEVAHLDLAALWLTERGWRVEVGSYISQAGLEMAAMVTDAPTEETEKSFSVAHANLCAVMQEELGLATDEIPARESMHPSPTSEVVANFAGGQAFGYSL